MKHVTEQIVTIIQTSSECRRPMTLFLKFEAERFFNNTSYRDMSWQVYTNEHICINHANKITWITWESLECEFLS